MNYGKNQLALLKFLHKYPDKWHRIKRRKAIDAARSLARKLSVYVIRNTDTNYVHVSLNMPENY